MQYGLKRIRIYGKIGKIFGTLPIFARKEAQMGKSLNGKELGKMVRSYRGKCVVKQFETIIKA